MSNSIIREKVYISKLQIGMYVCELDRPWLETPYPLQGFFLETEVDIQGLLSFCNFVYIDVRRSTENVLHQINDGLQPQFSKKDKQHIYRVKYEDSHSMEQELSPAKELFESMSVNTENLI